MMILGASNHQPPRLTNENDANTNSESNDVATNNDDNDGNT